MRRITIAASLLLAALPFLGVVPACHGTLDANESDADAGDAAIPPDQPLGSPCDPSLAEPCLPPAPCYSVTCDIIQGCTQAFTGCTGTDASSPFDFDGGSQGDGGVPGLITCSTTNQCPGLVNDAGVITTHTEVCGFPIIEACAATGVCVVPQPPMHPNGTVYTGCGCDGQGAVLYVSDNYTSEPVQAGGTPCPVDSGPLPVDSGPDGGPGDGSLVDADAGPGDATVSDATPEDAASEDANLAMDADLDASAAADASDAGPSDAPAD